jgi:hypothetical protein
MKRLALAIAVSVLSAAPTFATEIICGTVSRADSSTGELRLTEGSTFRVVAPSVLSGMAPGDHVRVTINNNRTVGVTHDDRYDVSPQRGGIGSCLQP